MGILVCSVVALIGAVAAWVEREKPLPPPRDDSRDWTGAFMRDWKRR